MSRASKTREEALARLQGKCVTTHTVTTTYVEDFSPQTDEEEEFDRQWGGRLQAFAEVFEWLEARRRQVNIPADSPEMQELLAAVREHRDFLNEQWHDGSDEEFKESLRRYARAVSQEMLRSYKARTHEPQESAQTSLQTSLGVE